MQLNDDQWGHLLAVASEHAHSRLAGSPHLADDVVSVVMRKMRAATRTPEPDALDAYVERTVAHEIAAHFRRLNSAARGKGTARGLSDEDALLWFVAGGQAQNAGNHDVWLAVAATLDDRARELIRLMADGTKQSVIAERLGYANASVVKVTVNRLRTRLRNEFARRSASA